MQSNLEVFHRVAEMSYNYEVETELDSHSPQGDGSCEGVPSNQAVAFPWATETKGMTKGAC